MFKFKIGQRVWFLVDPYLEVADEPEYLEGVITRRYIDEDTPHGSPDAYYTIKVEGNENDRGIYDREERDLYSSLKDLQEDVTGALMDDVEYYEKEVIQQKEQLSEAREDCRAARKRLRNWQQKCKEAESKQLDQDMRDPNVFYFC